MEMRNASLARGASGSMDPALHPHVLLRDHVPAAGAMARSLDNNVMQGYCHCHGLKKCSRDYSLGCIHRDHYRHINSSVKPIAAP
jgi:hypothetical protein